MSKRFFVTGIGTEVGKTVVSSILVEALQAAYWKPVQCGDLDDSDSHKIQRWTSIAPDDLFPEAYRLKHPMSPHAAAEREAVTIDLDNWPLPETSKNLIIEGAGGLEVPLNDDQTIVDIIGKWQLPVILVSRNYLGSINHTMLSIRALQQRNIPIAALIFNGTENKDTESIIQKMGKVKHCFRLPELADLNATEIKKAANLIRPFLQRI